MVSIQYSSQTQIKKIWQITIEDGNHWGYSQKSSSYKSAKLSKLRTKGAGWLIVAKHQNYPKWSHSIPQSIFFNANLKYIKMGLHKGISISGNCKGILPFFLAVGMLALPQGRHKQMKWLTQRKWMKSEFTF